jgi:cobalt-zinc-cadmium efflux system protein
MSHSHHHHSGKVNEKKLFLAIVLNIGITVAQVIGGFVSGSLALLSDALHNFSDVISLLVSYFASKLSRKQASTDKTFGYKRAEILAAFINASTLIIIAILLIIESIKRFNNPEEINSNLVIWLSALAIAFNGFSVLLVKSSAEKNINMKSAYLHLLTDMLASVAVLAGGLLMKYYEIYLVDSILTLAIALYLVWVGYDLLKTSTKMLMLFTPDHIKVEDIVNRVNSLEKVKKLHHVHVWSLNDDELHLEAHIDLNENISVEEFNSVLRQVEKLVSQEFDINHITLQPEYNKQDPKDIIVQD